MPEGSAHAKTADIEERNLLYVGVTRAKKSLILTQTLARVLKETKVYGLVFFSLLTYVYVCTPIGVQ